MTICIGMIASDGIVVAADSEENDGYFKRSQSKIFTAIDGIPLSTDIPTPSGACAIAGMGGGSYCDSFSEQLTNLFLSRKDVLDVHSLEPIFEERIKQFFQDHIIPFALYPSEERPNVSAIIGIYRRHTSTLFVTEGSTVRRGIPYCAIGFGQTFAMNLMDQLWDSRPLSQMEILAAYIIYRTKESVGNCGKFTSVVSLHNAAIVEMKEGGSQLVPPKMPLTRLTARDAYLLEENIFRARWEPMHTKWLWGHIQRESLRPKKK
jgi:20S proteasome alpha/beta subunit